MSGLKTATPLGDTSTADERKPRTADKRPSHVDGEPPRVKSRSRDSRLNEWLRCERAWGEPLPRASESALITILGFVNNDDGYAELKHTTVAKALRVSERQAQRAMSPITKHPRAPLRVERRGPNANRYHLTEALLRAPDFLTEWKWRRQEHTTENVGSDAGETRRKTSGLSRKDPALLAERPDSFGPEDPTFSGAHKRTNPELTWREPGASPPSPLVPRGAVLDIGNRRAIEAAVDRLAKQCIRHGGSATRRWRRNTRHRLKAGEQEAVIAHEIVCEAAAVASAAKEREESRRATEWIHGRGGHAMVAREALAWIRCHTREHESESEARQRWASESGAPHGAVILLGPALYRAELEKQA